MTQNTGHLRSANGFARRLTLRNAWVFRVTSARTVNGVTQHGAVWDGVGINDYAGLAV